MEIFGVLVTEWVGYLAMAVVLISFLMKDMLKLRIVNCIGCALFVVYGVLLTSAPIIITNLAILFINFYYLLINKR